MASGFEHLYPYDTPGELLHADLIRAADSAERARNDHALIAARLLTLPLAKRIAALSERMAEHARERIEWHALEAMGYEYEMRALTAEAAAAMRHTWGRTYAAE